MLLTAAAPAPDARVTLLDAMAEELQRNQQQLKLQNHEPPYFMSYQLKDTEQHAVVARYGALFLDDSYRERKLYVDVRVGSYELRQLGPRGVRLLRRRQGHQLHRQQGRPPGRLAAWRCAPRCGW